MVVKMGWNNVRDAFWDDPYGYLTKAIGVVAALLVVWAFTPWFPFKP